MHVAAPSRSPELTPPRFRFFNVTSADGTRLRAWTNDAQGPTVLLRNGLGTNPYAWPSLSDPGCRVRVISWNHRGIGGSARPANPAAVTMDEHVADALAVLDSQQKPHAVAMEWSIGVTKAEHAGVPLSSVDVSTVFVAGRWDLLTGRSHMRSAAERIPRATIVGLPGSHFLPMERPQEVHHELLRLLDRVQMDRPTRRTAARPDRAER